MKIVRPIVVAIIVGLIVGCGGSGSPDPSMLDARMETFMDKYQALDATGIEALTAPDFVDYANGVIKTRAEALQFIHDRKIAGYTLAITDRQTFGSRFKSGMEAFGFLSCKLTWTPPGGPADPPEAHSFVFDLRRDGGWLVTRRSQTQ